MRFQFWLLISLKISIGLVIILLGLSTLIPQAMPSEFYSGHYSGWGAGLIHFFSLDYFYVSGLNIGLWVWISLHLLGLMTTPGFRHVSFILTVLIFVAMLTVLIYDKTQNKRYTIVLREGRVVNLNDRVRNDGARYTEQVNLPSLRLVFFQITYHPGSQRPSEYRSTIIVNEKDSLSLRVNHPLKIQDYRLYQSSYQSAKVYGFTVNYHDYELYKNDTLYIGRIPVHIIQTDTIQHSVHIEFDDQFYRLTEGQERIIGQDTLVIIPKGEKLCSEVELVEYKGISWLMVLGFLFLPVLIWQLVVIKPGEV